MNKITFKFDFWLPNELSDYLLQLKGVNDVEVDKEQDIISVSYDSNTISDEVIYMDILAFLELQKVPSLLEFDKHSDEETNNYEFTIKSLCCEYCLKSNIEYLFKMTGIESASSDFNYTDKNDVRINITYNNQVISENDIRKLEAEFNN